MAEEAIMKMGEAAGFTLELSEPVEEIDGCAHVFRHKTGARLLYLENDDNNKGFSITFKTPANDDTGVFHILEHSVLCGSKKYPVKEPFVNLLKSSMQTFLNAMTFPDKTMYPVSSTNNKDLLNLASVYLDAVFHPNIYSNKRIFEQEGWHFEFDAEDDGALEFNGVVFNEMKGALSDSESVMFDALSAALFPDTTYKYESGGTPKAIPTLEYESFLNTHTRHYRPANSYIVLYGNLDLSAFFELLNTTLNEANNEDLQINPLDLQKPVVNMGIKQEMVTSPDSSCAAIGIVAADSSERERVAAIQILMDAIMGSNEAPMKKALLQADIADELEGALVSSLAQPFAIVSARGLHGEDAPQKLQEVVRAEAERLAQGELDEKIVEAALNHAEFSMREADFGVADGVYYSMSAMLGWLYDDSPEAALRYIRYEDVVKNLRDKLGSGYYAQLIKEIFIDGDHRASVQIVPVAGDEETEEEAKLKSIKNELSRTDLEEIVSEAEALHIAQMTPDSPEALATLPTLSRKDVDAPPAEPAFHVSKLGEIEVMRHDVETNGIVYVSKYFDMRRLTFEELPYASILALVLGKLDTKEHSASELDTLVQAELGSLSFSCETYTMSEDEKGVRPVFTMRASCLSDKVESLASLTSEILTGTVFSDREKLENILTQYKVAKEQQFIMSGDGVASLRAASYIMPSSFIAEQTSNIDFYKHVKTLLDDFDNSMEKLVGKLQDISTRLFVDNECLLSFAGIDDDYKAYTDAGASLGALEEKPKWALELPALQDKNEAFAVPADIVYCALVGDREKVASPLSEFSGIWTMSSRVLSYDYLWNEVRVVGGAYGVRFNSMRLGKTTFSSFRDPHVRETFDRFRASGDWLAKFDPQENEFEGFVVSTAASFDKPLKAAALIRRQVSMYLSHYDYKDYLKYRQQVLDSKLEQLVALAEPIKQICANAKTCIVGNKALIEQADLEIPVIELFDI